jgi:hypothetical protein
MADTVTMIGIDSKLLLSLKLDFKFSDETKNYSILADIGKKYKIVHVKDGQLETSIGVLDGINTSYKLPDSIYPKMRDEYYLVLDCSTEYSAKTARILVDNVREMSAYKDIKTNDITYNKKLIVVLLLVLLSKILLLLRELR